jgi:hypothetical protein
MIDEKIVKAFEKVRNEPVNQRFLATRMTYTLEWSILFNYYNSNLEPGGKKLGMACRSCFEKVLKFVREKIAQDDEAKLKSDEFRAQNIV